MKILGIDDRIVMPTLDTDDDGNMIQGDPEIVWYEQPITQEEADRQNDLMKSAEKLAENMDGKDAMMILQAMSSKKEVEATAGKPWTIRQAVISCLYTHRYMNVENDKQGNPPIEKADVVAEVHRIGHAFIHAPLYGFVDIDSDQMKLIRRKAYEFPLPGYVAGHLNRAFDKVEGSLKKHTVEYGESNGRQDNAEQTAEVAEF